MVGVDELLDWTKAEPEEVDNLKALERAAVEYIQQPGGRYFGVTAVRIELFPWTGSVIQLASEPAASPALVLEEWDGSAWAAVLASEIMLDGRLLYLYPTRTRPTRSGPIFRATYTAGYAVSATDSDVWAAPEDIKQAVRMLVSDWYEHPEGVREASPEVAVAVQNILRKYS